MRKVFQGERVIRSTEYLPLKRKGPVVPAPALDEPAGGVARAIAVWSGVVAATHWRLGAPGTVDGADFYVGAVELGHIHLDGDVHLATTRPLRTALLARGLAEPFPWYESWVRLPIRSDDEARHALWAIRLNYDRIAGVSLPELRARIAEYRRG
jgi:hypothetical protein